MKTAISVPDDLFHEAERLAREAGRSRSEVYSAALREYVSRHAPDHVTARLDAVVEEVEGADADAAFLDAAARGLFENSEW
jgi:metal-responsive CopG/Arc/MetJ family transcriptional regulator